MVFSYNFGGNLSTSALSTVAMTTSTIAATTGTLSDLFVSGNVTVGGTSFRNPFSILGNYAVNSTVGTVSTDIKGGIVISQTTSSVVLTLPTPTMAAYPWALDVVNSGTADFTMHAQTVSAGKVGHFAWSGTAWTPPMQTGVTSTVLSWFNGDQVSANMGTTSIQTLALVNTSNTAASTVVTSAQRVFIPTVSSSSGVMLAGNVLTASAAGMYSVMATYYLQGTTNTVFLQLIQNSSLILGYSVIQTAASASDQIGHVLNWAGSLNAGDTLEVRVGSFGAGATVQFWAGNVTLTQMATSSVVAATTVPVTALTWVQAYAATQSAGFAQGSQVRFTNVDSGTIPYNSATYQFTLTAGKRYRLTASIERTDGSSGIETSYSWYNATTALYFGSSATLGAGTTTNVAFGGVAIAVISSTVTTIVDVRFSKTQGSSSITTDASAPSVLRGILALIEEIPTSTVVDPGTVAVTALTWVEVYAGSQSAGVSQGSQVRFTNVDSGSIPYNTGTYQFTLTAGKRYRLTATIERVEGGGGVEASYSWYNTSLAAYFGSSGTVGTTNTANIAFGGIADAIISTTSSTIVELRFNKIFGATLLTTEGGAAAVTRGIHAIIEELPTSTVVNLGTDNITASTLSIGSGTVAALYATSITASTISVASATTAALYAGSITSSTLSIATGTVASLVVANGTISAARIATGTVGALVATSGTIGTLYSTMPSVSDSSNRVPTTNWFSTWLRYCIAYVGDVGAASAVSITRSSDASFTVSNGFNPYGTGSGNLYTISYSASGSGLPPVVTVTVHNNINSTSANDLSPVTLISVTTTSFSVYMEETNSTTQFVSLHCIMIG